MPESLHVWFMSMFKYAGDTATAHIIDDILKPGGIFSQRAMLTSKKGSKFLSILAEASPIAVLRLLEATIGKWGDDEILAFSENRQNLVWTLEKIAVWPTFTVRAMQLLSRLAINENAHYSNNSTGTLVGLFRIGPEWAVTGSSPEARLPVLLRLFRAPSDAERHLGLKVIKAALDSQGRGFRIVGPEYQGLKERAKLWMPETHREWWQAHFIYFQALVDETQHWPSTLRPDVCSALLDAVGQQIKTPPCTELAFQVLNTLVNDSEMLPEKLNSFFSHFRERKDDEQHPEITKKLRSLEHGYTRRNLASRFHRYVLDVDYMEWDEGFRERHNKPKSRAKALVNALACRIARHPEKFSQIQHLITLTKHPPALWYFSEQIAQYDETRALLPALIQIALETNHPTCLHGYLSVVKTSDPEFYRSTVSGFLDMENTAWLGAAIALRSDYDDELFVKCLDALDKKWITPMHFEVLRLGKSIESIPAKRTKALLRQLRDHEAKESLALLIEMLDSIPFDDFAPFDSEFVFGVVSRAVPDEEGWGVMRGYHWKNVCSKLIKWDTSRTLPLLDSLLTKMGEVYRLSYDTNVQPLANELVRANPSGAWKVVTAHFEETLPKWRSDLLNWLKGKSPSVSDEKAPRGAIADMPLLEILEWIEKDPEARASLIAHAAPRTLDNEHGGKLTRELLRKYGTFDGVQSGISATFHSGGWSGPTSIYLKGKRERFRRWLAAGFEIEITEWIEAEIESLDQRIEQEEIEEERSRFS